MALKLLAVLGLTITFALANSFGPPPGYTGGFREPNCTSCHGGTANDGLGSIEIQGVPEVYTPGECYWVWVNLERSGQRRWGFQLSSRFSSKDIFVDQTQAGWHWVYDGDTTVQIETVPIINIQYVQQTAEGTFSGLTDGPVTWYSFWCAPVYPLETIRFHAAGNAANGDGLTGGDRIYTTEVVSLPPPASGK